MTRLAPLALSLTLAACGAAAGPPAVAPSRPGPQPDEWTTQSWEDRHDTMTWGVLPTMARLFQRFHGTRYPELACTSCHGDDAEKVAYAMPNARLPPLDPAHIPTASSSPIAKFMIEEVTPEMRSLTGAQQLGCFSCHPRGAGR